MYSLRINCFNILPSGTVIWVYFLILFWSKIIFNLVISSSSKWISINSDVGVGIIIGTEVGDGVGDGMGELELVMV